MFQGHHLQKRLSSESSGIHAFVRRNSTRLIISACIVLVFLYSDTHPWEPSVTDDQPCESFGSCGPIPRKIWQIYFGYSPLGDLGGMIQTWPVMNQDSEYRLLSSEGADQLAWEHYRDQPEILETFLNLSVPVLRSDLLRYMILESQGGIYSDLDTTVLRPFTEWVPDHVQSRVRAIIGIEYDQGDREPYVGMPMPLQFCQWTMASSPGHPIMKKAVRSVVQELQKLVVATQTSIADLNPVDEEVVAITGPQAWTAAVLESLSEATGSPVSASNLTDLTQATLFGDILILPINAFGEGQPHSNSWRQEGHAPDALVRHMWRGSWKHDWPG